MKVCEILNIFQKFSTKKSLVTDLIECRFSIERTLKVNWFLISSYNEINMTWSTRLTTVPFILS